MNSLTFSPSHPFLVGPHTKLKFLILSFKAFRLAAYLSIYTEGIAPRTIQSVHHHCETRKAPLAKTHTCKEYPLNRSKKLFAVLFQVHTTVFPWYTEKKLLPYFLPTAWTFLLPHALQPVHTLYRRGCEKGKERCRHHMFTQFQPQQRSSSISAVPGCSDNKQTLTACPVDSLLDPACEC